MPSYTTGNGIEAMNVRSAESALARTVYRHTTQQRPALQVRARGNLPLLGLMGITTQETIERLLGIAPAHAQAVPLQAAALASAQAVAKSTANDQPGPLGAPADPQALIDHRYLWSTGGHLLLSQQRAGSGVDAGAALNESPSQTAYAYNAQGQLVAGVRSSGPGLGADLGAQAGQAKLSPVGTASAASQRAFATQASAPQAEPLQELAQVCQLLAHFWPEPPANPHGCLVPVPK
jgi:hypothetical protein